MKYNLDYLSSEDFDLMFEDELDEYYKLKNNTTMKEKKEEQVENPVEEQQQTHTTHLGCFEKIWDTGYDDEMDMVMLEVLLCNGEIIKVNMMGHHIKELNLFLNKEHANAKYLNYVMKK